MSTAWVVAIVLIAAAVIALSTVAQWWRRVVVFPWQAALVYRDGRFIRVLEAGRHLILGPPSRVTIVTIDTADRAKQFGQMDVVSADRFAFRIQLSARYAVTDPRGAYEAGVANPALGVGDVPQLYEQVAATALRAVGARALDEALADPGAIATTIADNLTGRFPHHAVQQVLLTKIDLPPETRRMLTDVERARRGGLAALERARGEQAALRTLANAARLMRDNPELAQLRLLSTIESAKGPTTIVVGNPASPVGPTGTTPDPGR